MRFNKMLCVEILTRLLLFACFLILEQMEPFHRDMLEEDLTYYSHKVTANTVSTPELMILVVALPVLTIVLWSFSKQDTEDLICGLLAFSLALSLNGAITNVLKVAVGRPRPDFFWRCFPSGQVTEDLVCNGDPSAIQQGQKSFPSGHASWMFTGYVFTSLYITGKLGVFSPKGRGQSLRLVVAIAPLLVAVLVSISRIRDRRHHPEDVIVGALLGTMFAAVCYYQFYPSLWSAESERPFTFPNTPPLPRVNSISRRGSMSAMEGDTLQSIVEGKQH